MLNISRAWLSESGRRRALFDAVVDLRRRDRRRRVSRFGRPAGTGTGDDRSLRAMCCGLAELGGMEADLVKRAGIPFEAIPAAGVHGVGLRARCRATCGTGARPCWPRAGSCANSSRMPALHRRLRGCAGGLGCPPARTGHSPAAFCGVLPDIEPGWR